jgi:hypothetical protein
MSVIQAQTSGKELRYVRCDDEGRLTTNLEATIDDVLMKGETAGGVKQPVLVETDGKMQVVAFGNTNPADPSSGVFEVLHTDGNGNLNTQIISTVTTSPANANNSILTNTPTKAESVGLFARTDIALGSSTVPLKCSAAGVLEVSSSGGGSGNANTFPTLASITTATNFAGGIINSNYIDLTNAKNVVINCIHTGNATARANFGTDIALSVEFTDADTNTVCYSGASTPVFATATIDAAGNPTGDAVAVLSFGENSEAQGQITGKFLRVSAVNNDVSGTGTAFAVTFQVVISGI